MFTFGDRAREEMRARGWSVRAAARALNFDHAYLSRVLSGRQRPSPALVEALDNLLGADGSLAALAPATPPNDEVERVTAALGQQVRADQAIADWVEQCLVQHRLAEDQVGGAAILPVVKAQLLMVEQLHRSAVGPVRDRLLRLASQYGQLLGWVHEDARNFPAALDWYDRTGELAVEAGDPDMAATVRSMKAHVAWQQRDGVRAVRQAEAALWHDGRVAPGVDALTLAQLARAYALLHDPDEAHRALDQAGVRREAVAADPDREPAWVYFNSPNWFLHQRALVELELGQGELAVELLDAAIRALPGSYHRDRIRLSAFKAKAHAVAGNLDAAADLAAEHASAAVALNGSAAHDLRTVARIIAKQQPSRGRELADALKG